MTSEFTVPVAHIDDPSAISMLLTTLRDLHGPGYEFAVGQWGGAAQIVAPPGAMIYRFLIETDGAAVYLQAGDQIRGPAPTGPYQRLDDTVARLTADHCEALWPGDVVTANDESPVTLSGSGAYFEVTVEATDYCTPRAAFLRNLADYPGGCAAYPGAFRREAIPPQRPAQGAADQRGVNRINEHTLDMRIDRNPTPIRHYHGPIAVDEGVVVNHSETAIVIPRAVYGLPEVDKPEEGHVLIYRQPATDPTDTIAIPVRPGSIVVTPATPGNTMGHCFENCFAMLIAIPGFVAPYHMLEE
ncbi:MAG: hypothetical protein KDE47_00970 [Caldilineaceae bacterium]|nr:hypothetical protein [Caldilineaceae bacterium]